MAAPSVLVVAGHGFHGEDEALRAFCDAGARGALVHLDDWLAQPALLWRHEILALPGGFSYGDHTGAGNATAERLRHRVAGELLAFVAAGRLVIGICNGCQVLVNLGLLPGLGEPLERQAALVSNASGRYHCDWVHLAVAPQCRSPWLRGLSHLYLPVAHGEGRFVLPEPILERARQSGQSAARYATSDGAVAGGAFPANPNGSIDDIAMLTDATGRVLGTMPHPERAVWAWQRPDWPRLVDAHARGAELPERADGAHIFANAVHAFAP